jgi:hypothetical protein
MITKFEINEKQEAQIKEWQDAVNKVYEEYGSFDFTFSPNGIGVGLKVYQGETTAEVAAWNSNGDWMMYNGDNWAVLTNGDTDIMSHQTTDDVARMISELVKL